MEVTFMHKNREIRFNIIYRKRKTMSLEIKRDGIINVIAPNGLDKTFIVDKVKNKSDWIIKKLDEIEVLNNNRYTRSYESGDIFLYLGNEYILEVLVDKTTIGTSVSLENNKLIVRSNSNNKDVIQRALKNWYTDETLGITKERINYYKLFFEDTVTSIKIKDQKSRWASCTYKNEILFNLRCSMMPIQIIDYIVVHEMCHMEHRNHSKDFYLAVERILPDYKERVKWLKNNGVRMNF
ncbi:SprT family zinc-dependent metalloprotease [Paraclostridium bifermentans]|jgi:predicted metal-dependent hydrolase|uniref:M48 family metallopeptidase n=1 Tax=Paraclostridium bifermentans TaxID=1490 RepID=UPI00189800D3|nr:SprT family zinc-dependent metalloprotease [Paraclostridium bifermentans]MBU5287063.1 M48 family metallopeptidase [Paraclostridium bifermentans]